MGRFHAYSFGNVLEIARQMPTATRVAGVWTWKNLGRSVRSAQKGIRILGPIVAYELESGPRGMVVNISAAVLINPRRKYPAPPLALHIA